MYCGCCWFRNPPNLYFPISSPTDKPRPTARQVQMYPLIAVRSPLEAEERSSRHSQVPADEFVVLTRPTVQPQPIQRERQLRNTSLMSRQLTQVSECTIALRNQLYRVLPRSYDKQHQLIKFLMIHFNKDYPFPGKY